MTIYGILIFFTLYLCITSFVLKGWQSLGLILIMFNPVTFIKSVETLFVFFRWVQRRHRKEHSNTVHKINRATANIKWVINHGETSNKGPSPQILTLEEEGEDLNEVDLTGEVHGVEEEDPQISMHSMVHLMISIFTLISPKQSLKLLEPWIGPK